MVQHFKDNLSVAVKRQFVVCCVCSYSVVAVRLFVEDWVAQVLKLDSGSL